MYYNQSAIKAGLLPTKFYAIAVGAGPRAFIINSAWIPNLLSTNLFRIGAAVVQPGNEDDRLWACGNFGLPEDNVSYSIKDQISLATQRVHINEVVVCICTPTGLHADHICEALEAGAKHIISDKPLVTSIAELRRIQAAMEKAGDAQVYVTFNHRYNGPVFQMRTIAAEAPDNVECIDAAFLQDWLTHKQSGQQADWRVADPRCGLLDIGSHAADLASFIAGSGIELVSGACMNRKGPFARVRGFSDHGTTDVIFENGIGGTIEYDQARPGHADDIYAVMTMTDGVRYMWRMAWGAETLWVSNVRDANEDRQSDWTPHLRGHSPVFDSEVNDSFGDTPGGHVQGWPQYWKALFEAIAVNIWNRMQHSICAHLPECKYLPVPTINDAGQNITQFIEANVLSAERNGDEVALGEVNLVETKTGVE